MKDSHDHQIYAANVMHIPVSDIGPNPHNPRRLFDQEPLEILKESIRNLGILVPITVYPGDGDSARYVLLDGERRWRCAKSLGLETVPAIVVEKPTDTQNILTMFHIHNLREGWQLMPTALKLQTLMKMLKTRNERKLSQLTKLSISQIRRCKILLSYPKKYQNLMLAPPNERLKADFFIELDRIRKPARTEEFPPWKSRGDSTSVGLILDKYLSGTIKAVTEFRKLAEVYRACLKQERLSAFYSELDRFLSDPDMPIDDIDVPGATFAKESKEIRRSASRLMSQITELDLEAISSDIDTISILKELMILIDSKLREALLIEAREEV